MSLPFDISEKLKSVQVRHYVEWLGRDSHCGYGFAFGYDEKSYRLIDELFQMLQDVETDDEDGAKELWLCARRGTIDDFAKQMTSIGFAPWAMLPTITMVRPLHPKRSTTGMPTEEMMV